MIDSSPEWGIIGLVATLLFFAAVAVIVMAFFSHRGGKQSHRSRSRSSDNYLPIDTPSNDYSPPHEAPHSGSHGHSSGHGHSHGPSGHSHDSGSSGGGFDGGGGGHH